MIVKYYQWTQNGIITIGRTLNGKILEAYRFDGLLQESLPFIFKIKEDIDIDLNPIEIQQPSIFVFKRKDGPEHKISIKDSIATLDGALLTEKELLTLTELCESGEIDLNYPIENIEFSKTESEEKYVDPITGAESLLALKSVTTPCLYLGVYDYKTKWEENPNEVQDFCKILVDFLLQKGSCVRLIGGSFLIEVENEQKGLEIAIDLFAKIKDTFGYKSNNYKVGFEILNEVIYNWIPIVVGIKIDESKTIS